MFPVLWAGGLQIQPCHQSADELITPGSNSSSILHLLSLQYIRCWRWGRATNTDTNEKRRKSRRSRMGVTWLQMDESVHKGYWICSPPGNAGHSLNDDKSVPLPGLNKSLTRHLSGSSNTQLVCVITASSTSAKNMLAFLVVHEELFGKPHEDDSSGSSLFFYLWYNVSKGFSSHTQCSYVAISWRMLFIPLSLCLT